jgi:hypothetical protein
MRAAVFQGADLPGAGTEEDNVLSVEADAHRLVTEVGATQDGVPVI